MWTSHLPITSRMKKIGISSEHASAGSPLALLGPASQRLGFRVRRFCRSEGFHELGATRYAEPLGLCTTLPLSLTSLVTVSVMGTLTSELCCVGGAWVVAPSVCMFP
jgi:hypothetical protein